MPWNVDNDNIEKKIKIKKIIVWQWDSVHDLVWCAFYTFAINNNTIYYNIYH